MAHGPVAPRSRVPERPLSRPIRSPDGRAELPQLDVLLAVRDSPAIPVDQGMAEAIAILSSGRRGAGKAREGGHPRTLSAVRERHGDALRITRILGERSYSGPLDDLSPLAWLGI